jgi:hypothetical protein
MPFGGISKRLASSTVIMTDLDGSISVRSQRPSRVFGSFLSSNAAYIFRIKTRASLSVPVPTNKNSWSGSWRATSKGVPTLFHFNLPRIWTRDVPLMFLFPQILECCSCVVRYQKRLFSSHQADSCGKCPHSGGPAPIGTYILQRWPSRESCFSRHQNQAASHPDRLSCSRHIPRPRTRIRTRSCF